jgi:hypothetical protein
MKQYEDYTPEDWAKLTGHDWRWLVRHQPQFAIRCAWEKLNGDDWAWLLITHPQFKQLRECFT